MGVLLMKQADGHLCGVSVQRVLRGADAVGPLIVDGWQHHLQLHGARARQGHVPVRR